MCGDLLVHHLALPVTDRCHVDLDMTRPRPVLGAMAYQRCDLRALDLVLAGQAIDVGARPTNPSALHHRRASSRSRHVPRQKLPARSTSENEELELFRLHFDLLREMRLFAVRREPKERHGPSAHPGRNCLSRPAVSSGFSSGKKWPPFIACPCACRAHCRQMPSGPPSLT